MNSVIIFDVSNDKSAIIRSEMIKVGYHVSWVIQNDNTKTVYNLPHNVVWKPNTEAPAAVADINAAIAKYNQSNPTDIIELKRCIVLNSTPWWGIPGKTV